TNIYPLSLHDALPIFTNTNRSQALARSPEMMNTRRSFASRMRSQALRGGDEGSWVLCVRPPRRATSRRSEAMAKPDRIWNVLSRSEEHTSELQSRGHL